MILENKSAHRILLVFGSPSSPRFRNQSPRFQKALRAASMATLGIRHLFASYA